MHYCSEHMGVYISFKKALSKEQNNSKDYKIARV